MEHWWSLFDDWEEVEFGGTEREREDLLGVHRVRRASSLATNVLLGLPEDLLSETLGQLEPVLEEPKRRGDVVSALCMAPISDVGYLTRAVKDAEAHGCTSTVATFRRVLELQPLINRFADLWLSLSPELFEGVDKSREELWSVLVWRGLLPDLVDSTAPRAFDACWFSAIREEGAPAVRIAMARLGNELKSELFPGIEHRPQIIAEDIDREREVEGRRQQPTDFAAGSAKFDRAIREIESIEEAVARGRDAQARKHLQELLRWQLQGGDGREHAVKSLCNLAKRCSNKFRFDFERECLQEALGIAPEDPWVLTQWGNHLKESGDFDRALEALRQAAELGEPVAKSSIADVFKESGDFDEARKLYESIPGYGDDLLVQTALADLTRASGDFESAEQSYRSLINRWGPVDRALCGLAEVSKSRGRFVDSVARFDELLLRPGLADHDRCIYEFSRGDALALLGRTGPALQAMEEILHRAPFMMRARAKKAGLLGAVGRPIEGLESLDVGTVDLREGWRGKVVRGLLWMKQDDIHQGRSLLLADGTSRMGPMAGESRDLPRLHLAGLAASHASLSNEGLNLDAAESYLQSMRSSGDAYSEYLLRLLQLHIAQRRRDRASGRELLRMLKKTAKAPSGIIAAGKKLRAGRFSEAWNMQTDLLLRAA